RICGPHVPIWPLDFCRPLDAVVDAKRLAAEKPRGSVTILTAMLHASTQLSPRPSSSASGVTAGVWGFSGSQPCCMQFTANPTRTIMTGPRKYHDEQCEQYSNRPRKLSYSFPMAFVSLERVHSLGQTPAAISLAG